MRPAWLTYCSQFKASLNFVVRPCLKQNKIHTLLAMLMPQDGPVGPPFLFPSTSQGHCSLTFSLSSFLHLFIHSSSKVLYYSTVVLYTTVPREQGLHSHHSCISKIRIDIAELRDHPLICPSAPLHSGNQIDL